MDKYGAVRRELIISTVRYIFKDFGISDHIAKITYGFSLCVGEFVSIKVKSGRKINIIIDNYREYRQIIILGIIKYWREINGK